MSNAGSSNRREKRWAPKVRTGCQNCKRRRIKCDEASPECQRCVKANLTCDGYEDAPKPKVFFSISELEKLKTLRDGSLMGRMDYTLTTEDQDGSPTTFHVEKVESDTSTDPTNNPRNISIVTYDHRKLSKSKNKTALAARRLNDSDAEAEKPGHHVVLRSPSSRPMDAVDPFRTSALADQRHASQLLKFWHVWTKGAPHANDALRICIQQNASFSSLLAANALFMNLLGLDTDGDKKYRLLTYHSLREVREQTMVDTQFISGDVGLSALCWLMIASWFSGETEATLTHLKGFRAVLDSGSRPLQYFPVYLQQVVVYIDFMCAMGTLGQPIIGSPSDNLAKGNPCHVEALKKDPQIEQLSQSSLNQLDRLGKSYGSNYSALVSVALSFIQLTHFHLAICMGALPMSSFSSASHQNYRTLLKILSFGFEGNQTVEARNTSRLGMILVLWSYSLVAPFGVLNNGGFFMYPDSVFHRFPRKYFPEVHEICGGLNRLFRKLQTMTAITTLAPRMTPKMTCDELGQLAEKSCGTDLSDAALLIRRYMDVAVSAFDAEHTMDKAAHELDLSRRLRFLGPLVAREIGRSATASPQSSEENSRMQ